MRFMREDEATKAINLFDGANESNTVSKTALKNWVVMVLFVFDLYMILSSLLINFVKELS